MNSVCTVIHLKERKWLTETAAFSVLHMDVSRQATRRSSWIGLV